MEQKFLKTPRLTTAYYRAGEENQAKLLLLHGNVSSSVFYLPFFEELSKDFDVVAPDLRAFGDSSVLPIDASRGFRDWSEDLHEFIEALGWKKFILCGWSMGGDVTMQYAIDYPAELRGIVLINPGSPYGFGGTRDKEGTPYQPIDLGAGACCANDALVKALAEGDRTMMKASLDLVYFSKNWKPAPEWEEKFIDAMLKTKVGEGLYPGDTVKCEEWPFMKAGKSGICNTMTPENGNLSAFADIEPKPPVLWVIGDQDVMVSDLAITEWGAKGKLGVAPGWPGEEEYPPQPMVSQTRYVLDQYAEDGGQVTELVLPGGHGCQLENPEAFIKALRELKETTED